MKIFYPQFFSVVCIITALTACSEKLQTEKTQTPQSAKIQNKSSSLKQAYEGKFLVGATIGGRHFTQENHPSLEIVKKHFSAVTMENSFKWEAINPTIAQYNFTQPDNFSAFASNNNITAVGHVLYWHSQTPEWVFKNEDGGWLTRDELLQRMRERAQMMAKRFGDVIKIWDVVNEAVEDNGELRQTNFHKIIGDDFIEQAFLIAEQELPKDATLIYNDYGMNRIGRRDKVIEVVNDLLTKNIRIGGIGLQGHWSMDQPSIEEIDTTLTAFATTGLPLHITELDIDYLGREHFFSANVDLQKLVATPENNPYPSGNFPADADQKLADRYAGIFSLFLKHHKNIDRVTFWGVTDADSWLNGWPVAGRTNYPLLFNRDSSPKLAVDALIQLTNQ